MKNVITGCLLAVTLLIGGMTVEAKTTTKKKTKARTSQVQTHSFTMNMIGTIGEYPAIVVLSINDGKAEGYYEFNDSDAPQSGKINLSGTYKPDPDPDMPTYPWFKALLTSKDASGKIIGKWDVVFETRTGSIEGTCTINGKEYYIVAEQQY